jgi:hypothetical protein
MYFAIMEITVKTTVMEIFFLVEKCCWKTIFIFMNHFISKILLSDCTSIGFFLISLLSFGMFEEIIPIMTQVCAQTTAGFVEGLISCGFGFYEKVLC